MAPATPLPGTPPAAPELLKVGDSVEAQFLLADQAVWTTSWYRGEVSAVNHGEGGGGGGGVTYGVSFADGDRLDAVPEAHIRLFRGLRVGSVVSVEWPSKGGRPFKGCLTKVCHGDGDGDGSTTLSVIFEDADTEVRVCCVWCIWCICRVLFAGKHGGVFDRGQNPVRSVFARALSPFSSRDPCQSL